MDKLFVALPATNVLQRWNLTSFQKEQTIFLPVQGTVTSLCMGSASTGPLLVGSNTGGGAGGCAITFLHPSTLKVFRPAWARERNPHFTSYLIRASADGRTFGFHDGYGGEPHALKSLALHGSSAVVNSVWPAGGSVAIPSPDGRFLYTVTGVQTPDFKLVFPKDGGGRTVGPFVPAAHGDFFVRLEPGPAGSPNPPGKLTFFLPSNERPIATLAGVEGVVAETGYYNPILYEKRLHFIPDAQLVVGIPPTNDKLVLHRFDLERAMEESDVDYLFVAGRPPAARKGDLYRFPLTIKSKKGGVKVNLDAGPKGLKVTPEGQLTWAVPPDFPDAEASIILTVSDSAGQEVLHSFKVAVE